MSVIINEKIRQKLLFKSLIFEASLGFVAVLLGFITNFNPLNHIHYNTWEVLYAVLISFVLFGLFIGITKLNWKPLMDIRKQLEVTLLPLFKDFNWLDIALISILAGVCEELAFRGWIEGFSQQYLSVIGAFFLTNILFGLAHFITPLYALIAFLIGSLLSLTTWYWDNLLGAMVIHSVYDFLALAWLLKFKRPIGDIPN